MKECHDTRHPKSRNPIQLANARRKRGSEKGCERQQEDLEAAADRPNKKAEVIAMMKRPKGAMLTEIVKATDWQPEPSCRPLVRAAPPCEAGASFWPTRRHQR